MKQTENIARLIWEQAAKAVDMPFSDMERFDIDSVFPLPSVTSESIESTLNVKTEKELEFETRWEEGAILGIHTHSDCIEIIEPIEGMFLIIRGTEKIKLKPGEYLTINNGVEHVVASITGKKLKVRFIKL